MKRFIFFRSDRLGDFLTLTGILNSIKTKYKNSNITLVCSPLNYTLVKHYKNIDCVHIYDRKFSLIKKISIFFRIINNQYFCSFSLDGKSFSNLCTFFIKSKYKLGLVYKFKFLNIWFSKPNFLYNYFIFNKVEFFTSKKYLNKVEHLASKFLKLANFLDLNLTPKDTYHFIPNKKNISYFKNFYLKYIKRKYILVHLDEKWNDITLINKDLFRLLLNLQNQTGKKIIITSFNNKFEYFKILKKQNSLIKSDKNLMIIENSNLFFFERLIKHAICVISCHSGFITHISGANSARLLDIINRNDLIWYSCWVPKGIFHKFIFKGNKNKLFSISKIFNNLTIEIKNIRNF